MIMLKSREEIELMRHANVIVAEVLAELRARVRPGVTTGALDAVAEEMTRKHKARPAFKGYEVAGRVYPRSVCISINEEVVHGIPSDDRALQAGDIVGLDFGVCYEGYFGDAAMTVPVGAVTTADERLMRVTSESLQAGIQEVCVGKRIGDISAAIQEHAEREGYSVVRDFVGHGIGKRLHEDPQVPNFGLRDRGVRLRAGMVLAIEPMVNAGVADVMIKDDGWTAVTVDGQRSAHFEHSVAVTDKGPYVLSEM
ncbi:MAG: type I methionyl aminopeptidase [Deltaproteobacteria bacterium]|nr:type I methionyl aminopeptidase [Deltaproteobacteria bacterium]MBI3391069.1 type I methionyl aminopeptidase [Deltaproteobacteria bacterium]